MVPNTWNGLGQNSLLKKLNHKVLNIQFSNCARLEGPRVSQGSRIHQAEHSGKSDLNRLNTVERAARFP